MKAIKRILLCFLCLCACSMFPSGTVRGQSALDSIQTNPLDGSDPSIYASTEYFSPSITKVYDNGLTVSGEDGYYTRSNGQNFEVKTSLPWIDTDQITYESELDGSLEVNGSRRIYKATFPVSLDLLVATDYQDDFVPLESFQQDRVYLRSQLVALRDTEFDAYGAFLDGNGFSLGTPEGYDLYFLGSELQLTDCSNTGPIPNPLWTQIDATGTDNDPETMVAAYKEYVISETNYRLEGSSLTDTDEIFNEIWDYVYGTESDAYIDIDLNLDSDGLKENFPENATAELNIGDILLKKSEPYVEVKNPKIIDKQGGEMISLFSENYGPNTDGFPTVGLTEYDADDIAVSSDYEITFTSFPTDDGYDRKYVLYEDNQFLGQSTSTHLDSYDFGPTYDTNVRYMWMGEQYNEDHSYDISKDDISFSSDDLYPIFIYPQDIDRELDDNFYYPSLNDISESIYSTKLEKEVVDLSPAEWLDPDLYKNARIRLNGIDPAPSEIRLTGDQCSLYTTHVTGFMKPPYQHREPQYDYRNGIYYENWGSWIKSQEQSEIKRITGVYAHNYYKIFRVSVEVTFNLPYTITNYPIGYFDNLGIDSSATDTDLQSGDAVDLAGGMDGALDPKKNETLSESTSLWVWLLIIAGIAGVGVGVYFIVRKKPDELTPQQKITPPQQQSSPTPSSSSDTSTQFSEMF